MVPQKDREASELICNSGFFITANKYPGFGAERDGEAIKRRLKIFQTKVWTGKIIPSLVIFLHMWIIDHNKEFAVCFFEILETLNFPTQYGFKKHLNSYL